MRERKDLANKSMLRSGVVQLEDHRDGILAELATLHHCFVLTLTILAASAAAPTTSTPSVDQLEQSACKPCVCTH